MSENKSKNPSDKSKKKSEFEQTFVRFNEPEELLKSSVKDGDVRDFAVVQAAGSLMDSKKLIQEILNEIQAPRLFEADSRIWRQSLSTAVGTRKDAVELGKKLKKRMNDSEARGDCFCSIRRKIYEDLFNELIRQATVECPALGILLVRIRDEAAYSMKAYEALYSGTIDFSLKKAGEKERKTEAIFEAVEELLQNEANANEEMRLLVHKYDLEMLRAQEEFEGKTRVIKEKIAFLTDIKKRLQTTINAVIEGQKKNAILG